MTKCENELTQKTEKFALEVMALGLRLPPQEPAMSIGRQLIRCATGVGASFQSPCPSRSQTQFAARVRLALDEIDESAVWLEIVADHKLSEEERALTLLEEANQLCATLAASAYEREYASWPPT